MFLVFYSCPLISSTNRGTTNIPPNFDKDHIHWERTHIDHAPLDPRHSQRSKRFFDKMLKKNGQYDKDKIYKFIKRLEREKSWIQDDAYETQLLEKLELELKKYPKATKSAEKKRDEKKSRSLRAHSEYLIPLMEDFYHLVSHNKQSHLWDSMVTSFARGYYPFYVPHAHRTIWHLDSDTLYYLYRLYTDMRVDREYNTKVEANNLIVDLDNFKDINRCLQETPDVVVGSYLTQKQLDNLERCGFDLSTLEPGISAMWEPKTREQYFEKIKNQEVWFPQKSDRIYFDKVSYRGVGTVKFNGWFLKDGKEQKIKIKMGNESHTDLSASRIFELIGYHQDHLRHVDQLKMYFEEGDSFEEFSKIMANKYRLHTLAQFITAHGKDEDGSEWVLFEDVTLEARPDYEIRVAPLDIASWDLPNRRESRALILAFGWLELADVPISNYKLIYQQTDCCGLLPKIRFQDTGQAMGGPNKLNKLPYSLSLFEIYKVNAFPSSFVKRNAKGDKVKVRWNDFLNKKENFQTATFYDLKWMARKIAAVKKEDIFDILVESGMPKDVADIFTIKLMMRKNEMLTTFELDEEIPYTKVPDLESYSPNKNIKKGKVITPVYPGKNIPHKLQNTVWTFLQGLATLDLRLLGWHHDPSGHAGNVGLPGLTGVRSTLGVGEIPISSTAILPLAAGVNVTLTRRVEKNFAIMNQGGMMRLFKVTDRVSLQIGVDSGLLNTLLLGLPFGIGFQLNFYTIEFEHIHYADDGNKAYKSAFELHKICSNLEYFAAYKLKPLELVQKNEIIGLDAAVGVAAYGYQYLLFSNEISATAGVHKIISKYYTRDQYNQLHFFDDRLNQVYAGFNLDIAKISPYVMQLPLLSLQAGDSGFKLATNDFYFANPVHDRRVNGKSVTPAQRLKEYVALKRIKKGQYKHILSPSLKTNYTLNAKGTSSVNSFGALFLFYYDKIKQKTSTQIDFENGLTRSFYRYHVERSHTLGLNRTSIPFVTELEVLIARRKREKITIELDQFKPKDFLCIIRNEDYYLIQKPKDTPAMINDLNLRYSLSDQEPFYRNYFLPKVKDVKKYKKVYAYTRVFINGSKITELFENKPLQYFKPIALRHFSGSDRFVINSKLKHLNIFRIAHITYKTAWIMHSIKKIKKISAKVNKFQDREKQEEANRQLRRLARTYEKFAHRLHTGNYGIYFLKETLGTKGMYVMGDISGLMRSFSTLQELQQIQRVRFAGKSWGTYKVVPPIQKFLRKQRPLPPSIYIDKNISDAVLFGSLESGVPENLNFVYKQGMGF